MSDKLEKIKELLEDSKQSAVVHPDPLSTNDTVEISFDANCIAYLINKVEVYEGFIRACRFAGEGGLPQLREEANKLLKS